MLKKGQFACENNRHEQKTKKQKTRKLIPSQKFIELFTREKDTTINQKKDSCVSFQPHFKHK